MIGSWWYWIWLWCGVSHVIYYIKKILIIYSFNSIFQNRRERVQHRFLRWLLRLSNHGGRFLLLRKASVFISKTSLFLLIHVLIFFCLLVFQLSRWLVFVWWLNFCYCPIKIIDVLCSLACGGLTASEIIFPLFHIFN